MKQLASLCLVFVLLNSCGKSTEKKADTRLGAQLYGGWMFTGSYYSIAGPEEWHPADTTGISVIFAENGTLQTNGIYTGANRYIMIDSTTVEIQPLPTEKGYARFSFKVTENGNKLTLSPIDPACIEGCSSVFVRYLIID